MKVRVILFISILALAGFLPVLSSARGTVQFNGRKVIYGPAIDKGNCFFVVSKVHPEHLSVYESRDGDTVLLAVYPACLAKN